MFSTFWAYKVVEFHLFGRILGHSMFRPVRFVDEQTVKTQFAGGEHLIADDLLFLELSRNGPIMASYLHLNNSVKPAEARG